jgi:hypothetical protein
MKAIAKRSVAAALVAVVLTLPAGLSAKAKRGATLVVTRLDGTQVSGELIAVKPDTLLLLNAGAADLSVPFGDIHSVRIVRRSKIGKGVLYGFLAGALGGAVWGAANQDPDVWGEDTPSREHSSASSDWPPAASWDWRQVPIRLSRSPASRRRLWAITGPASPPTRV